MKGGPTTPTLKRYIKACESVGYETKAIRMCYGGDVIMYFDDSISTVEASENEWEARIEET